MPYRYHPAPPGFGRGVEHAFAFPWGGLVLLAVLGLLVVAVVLLILSWRRRPATPAVPAAEQPLQAAARRYAAGEIGQGEFERIQRDLAGPAPSADPLQRAAQRLAAGEIDVAEFDRIRAEIKPTDT